MYRLYGIYTAFTISYGDVPDPLRICRGKDCAENITVIAWMHIQELLTIIAT